jgi:hypothetical protein
MFPVSENNDTYFERWGNTLSNLPGAGKCVAFTILGTLVNPLNAN